MATYYVILTNYGIAADSAALISGIPTLLTNLALGDGGGAPVIPNPASTALVNEVYRTTVNRVQQDTGDATIYYVEAIIPYSVGGWTIREFAIFDSTGNEYATGNFPDTVKTIPTDGTTNDLVIRVQIKVANAGTVNIVVDPTVAIASQAWVISYVSLASLAPGGTTGQVLTKISNTNGDANWETPGSASILVPTIEETHTITSGQTVFAMTTTTTLGLAVYVKSAGQYGSERLPNVTGATGWQQGVDTAHVVLGTAYGSGSDTVTFVQNDPLGALPTPLEKSLNLSDLADLPTARNNLEVFSQTQSLAISVPPGMVAMFAGTSAPTGWLIRNGSAVSRSTYSALFSAIGITWGAGDGSTTFNLPDARGEFERGADLGRGVEPGRAVGSFESYATASPQNTTPQRKLSNGTIAGLINASNPSVVGFARAAKISENVTVTGTDGSQNLPYGELDTQNVVTGDAETRPRNWAYLPIIKT